MDENQEANRHGPVAHLINVTVDVAVNRQTNKQKIEQSLSRIIDTEKRCE